MGAGQQMAASSIKSISCCGGAVKTLILIFVLVFLVLVAISNDRCACRSRRSSNRQHNCAVTGGSGSINRVAEGVGIGLVGIVIL